MAAFSIDMKRIKALIMMLALCVGLGACSVQVTNEDVSTDFDAKIIKTVEFEDWREIEPGLAIKQYLFDDKITMTALKYFGDNFDWAIAQDVESPKTVADWQKALKAKVAINGGYFDENNGSTGYLLIDGQEYGRPSRDGQNGYTGMLTIKDGRPSLRYLPENNYAENEKSDFALQTFPTLINNGSSLIAVDSGKTARRQVLAQNKNGEFFIIAVEGFVSLYELADWLANSELDLSIAINLDGGPSVGLSVYVDDFNYNLESAFVPNIIFATN